MATKWLGSAFDSWQNANLSGDKSKADEIYSNPSEYSSGLSNVLSGVVEDITGKGSEDLWKDYTGLTANEQNIEYQKDYNQQVWNRADTQYQRTVADLRAAGLSSQLAAGSPSTVAGQTSAPQRTVGNESAAIESIIGLVNAIKSTNANVSLAGAQEDKARAEAADARAAANLKDLEAGNYVERMSVDMALKSAQVNYYNEYTTLLQEEGKYKADLIQSEIQRNLSTSSYQNNLADLAVKQMDLVSAQTTLAGKQSEKIDADINEINKRISLIGYQISSEVAKKRNYDASTEYIIRQTTNAALDYVIQDAIFQFNTNRGDAPNATQVSSSQSEEKRKERMHDYILKGIGLLGGVATGAASSFMFGVGRGINKKMFGDDHIDPWTIVR